MPPWIDSHASAHILIPEREGGVQEYPLSMTRGQVFPSERLDWGIGGRGRKLGTERWGRLGLLSAARGIFRDGGRGVPGLGEKSRFPILVTRTAQGLHWGPVLPSCLAPWLLSRLALSGLCDWLLRFGDCHGAYLLAPFGTLACPSLNPQKSFGVGKAGCHSPLTGRETEAERGSPPYQGHT